MITADYHVGRTVGRAPVEPAQAMLVAILAVVPPSSWMFAREDATGALDSLLGSAPNSSGLARLADELKRQRIKAPNGPCIGARLGPLEDYAHGITLVFADSRSSFGILSLLRTAELGPFTASEVSMLAFALDAISDRLAPNSLAAAATRFHISPRELQVLALLLDGNHLSQVAALLHITSSTVQDHIKSMLDKTESRNRSELIARVLGWESKPNAPQASVRA